MYGLNASLIHTYNPPSLTYDEPISAAIIAYGIANKRQDTITQKIAWTPFDADVAIVSIPMIPDVVNKMRSLGRNTFFNRDRCSSAYCVVFSNAWLMSAPPYEVYLYIKTLVSCKCFVSGVRMKKMYGVDDTMSETIRVTVWNEFRHEKEDPKVAQVYPEGIHQAIAAFMQQQGFTTRTATLDEPSHGLTPEVLDDTDVLIWWGHAAHQEVADEIVQNVVARVLSGMGLIVLHSGHFSKVFKALMGTSCDLKWREVGENERLWIVEPTHPIVEGIDEWIDLPHEEMYGEHFDIPVPDELIFISWFAGGEVFRSGVTYRRGQGKIFYFRPGHESYPTYYHPAVQTVLTNAVKWAAPVKRPARHFGNVKALQ